MGKYMQYGLARTDGRAGLFVMNEKKNPELAASYYKHPDQFEIFANGEVNGQQALIPGPDFEKFRPIMSKVIDIGWCYTTPDEGKRLVFMSVNSGDRLSVNPRHPEWESPAVRIARKLGYTPPDPKSKEKFSFSFLHPGLFITAEVLIVKQKGSERTRPQLDIDTIEVVSGDSEPQKNISEDDIDPEIKMTILEMAEGCKSAVEVIKKVKAYLKEQKVTDPAMLGHYSAAISRMKDRKEILV